MRAIHPDANTGAPNAAAPAVVLLSGGLDSATVLAIARERGFTANALSFRYGQRHEQEIEAARRVAAQMGVERHAVVDIDLGAFGGSALTSNIPVPKDRDDDAIGTGIPVTYVPARNTIFLAIALGWAETLGADDIFIGVNAVDYSGYPDCRPEFLQAFEHMANLATKAATEDGRRLTVHAPLLDLTKAEIVRRGASLGIDFSLTRSCYDPDDSGAACGRCDACHLRLRGFAEAGIEDPAPYAAGAVRIR
jgi:7-cyano-7-deazaguanine synthase